MAPPRVLPPIDQLLRWVEAGYTHDEITGLILEQTGQQVSRSSISVALHRAGKTATLPRFDEELPWTVRSIHAAQYPARMLRALGRRRRGMDLAVDESRKLDNWLTKVSDHGIVVAYDDEHGFFYVPAKGGDGADGIPIRRGITRIPNGVQPDDII